MTGASRRGSTLEQRAIAPPQTSALPPPDILMGQGQAHTSKNKLCLAFNSVYRLYMKCSRNKSVDFSLIPFFDFRYMCRKEHSMAFKIRQSAFSTRLCPIPRWGSPRRFSKPPSQLGKGHPFPYPIPLDAKDSAPLALATQPQCLGFMRHCPPNIFY